MSTLDIQVQSHLRTLLDQYFHSLQGGVDDLSSFLAAFTEFAKTLQLQRCHLKPETLDMIPHFINVISTNTSSIIDLVVASDAICSDCDKEISSMLSAEIGRLSIGGELKVKEAESFVTSAPYVRLACQWLLANLHNPYPTKEVIASISQQAGSSSKNINAWFVDARKRIGWNDLRNKRFGKKKDAILKAAGLFFKPDPEDSWREGVATLAHDDYLAFETIHVSAVSQFGEPGSISSNSQSTSLLLPLRHLPSVGPQKKRARSCDLDDSDRVESGSSNKRIRLNRSFSEPCENLPIEPRPLIRDQPRFRNSSLGTRSNSFPLSCGKRKRSESDNTEKRSSLVPDIPDATQSLPSTCSGSLSSVQFDWSVLDELDFNEELPPPVSTASLGENPIEIDCYQFDATLCGTDGRLSPLFSGIAFDLTDSYLQNCSISPTSSMASLEMPATFDHSSPASETLATPESFTCTQLLDDETINFGQNLSDSVSYSDFFDLTSVTNGFVGLPTEFVSLAPDHCQTNNIGLYEVDDKITKYRRAQMLRAELQRLETDLSF